MSLSKGKLISSIILASTLALLLAAAVTVLPFAPESNTFGGVSPEPTQTLIVAANPTVTPTTAFSTGTENSPSIPSFPPTSPIFQGTQSPTIPPPSSSGTTLATPLPSTSAPTTTSSEQMPTPSTIGVTIPAPTSTPSTAPTTSAAPVTAAPMPASGASSMSFAFLFLLALIVVVAVVSVLVLFREKDLRKMP